MANRITNEEIKKINELYAQYHNYSKVAREVGVAPTTVKKYIIPNYEVVDESNFIRFTMDDIPDFDGADFIGVDNYGDLCVLSDAEKEEIKELWKELSI